MKQTLITAGFFFSAMLSAQISNADLVKMKEAGISEEIIKTKIATEDSKFDTSTNAILELKNKGFSDDVISLIIQKNAALKSYSERTGTDVTNQEINLINSIREENGNLIINETFNLAKGDNLKIYLPATGQDFMFITPSSGFNMKLLGKIADVVGTGASAVGISTGNIKVLEGANKVLNGATAVRWGADALEKINELPISKKAKRIAGKQIRIIDWKLKEDDYTLTGEVDKKKYLINLKEAVLTKEIILKKD